MGFLQELANNSPQAKQAAKLKALAKAKTDALIRQKKSNGLKQVAQAPQKEDLIQGKTQSAQCQGTFSDRKPRDNKTGLPLDHLRIYANSPHPAQLH